MSIKRLKKLNLILKVNVFCLFRSFFNLSGSLSNFLLKSGSDLFNFIMTIQLDSKNSDGKSGLKPDLIMIKVKILFQVNSITQAQQATSEGEQSLCKSFFSGLRFGQAEVCFHSCGRKTHDGTPKYISTKAIYLLEDCSAQK